jgi:hypothetical protein
MQAVNCARIMRGMVYRVQPIGRLGPDDNDVAGPDYAAPRALILAPETCRRRRLDEKEFHRLHSDYAALYVALGSLDA